MAADSGNGSGVGTHSLPVIFHNKHRVHVSSSVSAQQQAFLHYLNGIMEAAKKQGQSNGDSKLAIGFSGGSMPEFIAPLLLQLPEQVCNRLYLFPVDERLVPLDNADSNAGTLIRLLQSQAAAGNSSKIPIERVLHVPDDLLPLGGDNNTNSFRAAQQFERQLHALDPHIDDHGFPVFDLLLLGLGPDGHTCSLFPGHPLLNDRFVWVSHLDDSPKPPQSRITVTLPVLNAARHLAFIANGAAKADAIKQIVALNNQQLPPSRIALHTEGEEGEERRIEWFIDEEAAAKLLEQQPK